MAVALSVPSHTLLDSLTIFVHGSLTQQPTSLPEVALRLLRGLILKYSIQRSRNFRFALHPSLLEI